MKKTLVLLLSAMVISIGSAQAATTSSVTNWLDKTSSAITKAEQDTTNKIEKRKKEAAAKKAEREKAAAEKKAAAEAKKKAIKDDINTQKTFWKKLFTWDWD